MIIQIECAVIILVVGVPRRRDCSCWGFSKRNKVGKNRVERGTWSRDANSRSRMGSSIVVRRHSSSWRRGSADIDETRHVTWTATVLFVSLVVNLSGWQADQMMLASGGRMTTNQGGSSTGRVVGCVGKDQSACTEELGEI